MNIIRLTRLTTLISILVYLLSAANPALSATFSGKVVDADGKPIENVNVTIESRRGKFIPNRNRFHMHEQVFPPPEPSKTDANGIFSIDNIVSPSVNSLKPFGGFWTDYELISIEMHGISFYIHPHQYRSDQGFLFGVEEDTDITDVKITVRLRMKISGQVLDAAGTPLSNARVDMRVSHRSIDGRGRGSGGGTRTLDPDGKFTRYVNSPAYYTVTVTYQRQTVKSEEILLEKGQRLEGLTLKLKEAEQPEKLKEPEQPKIPKEIQPIQQQEEMERRRAAMERRRKGVWAINPANRHAYKRIDCDTPEEAIEQAKEEGAHLVSINDAAEQEWLLHVFGKLNYWIGYTDGLKKNDKQWDDGDPLTYTNWDTENLISEPDNDIQDKEQIKYSVLIGVTGKWQRVRADSPVVKITEKAILEKVDLIIGTPQPDEDME